MCLYSILTSALDGYAGEPSRSGRLTQEEDRVTTE